MNKTLLIPILVVGAVVIGILAFLLLSKSPSVTTTPDNSNLSATNSESIEMEKSSFSELMKLGSNQQCTFRDDMGNAGEMHIGQGKVRGDFMSQNEGETAQTHMISDGQDVYLWFDGQTDGFKTSLTSLESFEQGNDTPRTIDINKSVEYSCTTWAVDASQFIVPDTITFNDFSSLMMMQEGSAETEINVEGNAEQCAACDSLPAEAAVQCKAALGC